MARRVAKKELSTRTITLVDGKPMLYKDVLPLRTIPCMAWWVKYSDWEHGDAEPANGILLTAVDVPVETALEMAIRMSPTGRGVTIQNMTVGQVSNCMLISADQLYFNDARAINEKGEVVL